MHFQFRPLLAWVAEDFRDRACPALLVEMLRVQESSLEDWMGETLLDSWMTIVKLSFLTDLGVARMGIRRTI